MQVAVLISGAQLAAQGLILAHQPDCLLVAQGHLHGRCMHLSPHDLDFSLQHIYLGLR